jgi:hypothetical protein
MWRKERREVGTTRANFLRRTQGRLRRFWRSAPAPLRAYSLHRTPSLYLRLLANLPRPDVSPNRPAPQAAARGRVKNKGDGDAIHGPDS